MFHREFKIASTQVNASRQLKLASLLQLFQDVAIDGAAYIGCGTDVTFPRGLLWVVTRMEIDIKRMPAYEETIDIYTYPGMTMGFFYPRHFFVKDASGEIIIRGASIWALIHESDRHLEMKNQFPDIPGTSMEGEIGRPAKLKANIDAPLLETRKIRYSDVDLNRHLNNTKYIEIIEDLLPGCEHERRVLTHVAINYDRELHEGDILELHGDTGMDFFVTGISGSIPVFEIALQYKPWMQNQ